MGRPRQKVTKHPRILKGEELKSLIRDDYQFSRRRNYFGNELNEKTPFEKLVWVMQTLHRVMPVLNNSTFLLKDGYLMCHLLASEEEQKAAIRRKRPARQLTR